jgi:hypothetical protein
LLFASIIVDILKSWILTKSIIKFSELPKRCSIVLRGSLSEDVNTEVGLVDLIVVLLLILFGHGLTLSLETGESALQLLLLLGKSLLDDLGSSEETLLKVLESFVLDKDGSLFV